MFPEILLFDIRIPTFSVVLMLAVFICILFYVFSRKYTKYNQVRFLSSLPYVLASAAIVGRLFSAFTLSLQNRESIWRNFLRGGNILYASVVGGIICLLIIAKRRAESALDYLDVYASIVPLGQSIGRIGCYCNGCCFGREYSGPLSVRFIVDGEETRVFPTWFIESLFCFLLFLILQRVITNNQRGRATSVYCISYSLFRFFIEFGRGDIIRGIWNGFSTSQILSIVIFAFGLIIIYKQAKHPRTNTFIALSSERINKGVG